MKRALVVALILSVAHASAAFAGETLLQAATRAAERLAAAEASTMRSAPAGAAAAAVKKTAPARRTAAFQQIPRGLDESGIRTRTKVIFGAALAAALAGIMLSVDGSVEDSTPSTKGERTNDPF
jgi:hypothetical protein